VHEAHLCTVLKEKPKYLARASGSTPACLSPTICARVVTRLFTGKHPLTKGDSAAKRRLAVRVIDWSFF
jgi:hypothetical protein